MEFIEPMDLLAEMLALRERKQHMTLAERKLEEAEAKVESWQTCAFRNGLECQARMAYLTSQFGDLDECEDDRGQELIQAARAYYAEEQSSRDWGVEIWEEAVVKWREKVKQERDEKRGGAG